MESGGGEGGDGNGGGDADDAAGVEGGGISGVDGVNGAAGEEVGRVWLGRAYIVVHWLREEEGTDIRDQRLLQALPWRML